MERRSEASFDVKKCAWKRRKKQVGSSKNRSRCKQICWFRWRRLRRKSHYPCPLRVTRYQHPWLLHEMLVIRFIAAGEGTLPQ